MKKLHITLLLALMTGLTGFSQSFLEAYEATRHFEPFDHVNGLYNDEFNTLTGNPAEWSKVMGVLAQFDDIELEKKGIQGSVMLFSTKDKNQGKVYSGKKVYILNDLNYNIKSEQFQTKLENDSIFIYNLEGLSRVQIKDKDFSVMYNPVEGKREIYEVVQAGKKMSLLKKYSIRVQKASPNPMVNRKQTKIQKKWKYYAVDYKDNIVEFKGKKKALLELARDNEDKKALKDYISNNRLSVKKEDDLKKIFDYLNKL